MTQLSLILPQIGITDATEDVKIQNAFTAIQNTINGSLDAGNLSAVAAQAAGMNQPGQVVKGSSIIATAETRTNVAYGLMPTPDQIQNLVLPAAGLIAVWYQAQWSNTVASNGQAGLFLGANQVVYNNATTNQAVAGFLGANASFTQTLYTSGQAGLQTTNSGASAAANVTTGEMLGGQAGTSSSPVYLFASAGTYTVSVQFLAASGTLTVSNRRLYAQVVSFV